MIPFFIPLVVFVFIVFVVVPAIAVAVIYFIYVVVVFRSRSVQKRTLYEIDIPRPKLNTQKEEYSEVFQRDDARMILEKRKGGGNRVLFSFSLSNAQEHQYQQREVESDDLNL